ncbi:metal-dependent hydrolase [Sphingomicrobium marinum]|uniref:metal-dependent hydrolase n=1 Tax=Sphingomicrobium marinum TaxID=1227950 RepID=UPI00223FCB05|nr:metal-dependent hydrolase [Sphingomicrobium marinum]
MPTATVTPIDLAITPRDRRFGREDQTPRHWHGGDPYATAFYNALSITFPKGEAFFVDSVRAFRHGADPRLAEDIKNFVTQEAMHSREHVAFNNRAADAGYDIKPLEDKVQERLDFVATKPKIASLAATMALEHFTAILAHELLANPKHLEGADEATAELWRWHASEEIEHKGVAFDTWMHATKDWSRTKRWKVKSLVMVNVTYNFLKHRWEGMLELLRQDGLTGAKAKWHMFKYAVLSPGMVRKWIKPWIAYFLPSFHPWNEDDRQLIRDYDAAVGTKFDTTGKKVRRAA